MLLNAAIEYAFHGTWSGKKTLAKGTETGI
jgi:hypothetical protein